MERVGYTIMQHASLDTGYRLTAVSNAQAILYEKSPARLVGCARPPEPPYGTGNRDHLCIDPKDSYLAAQALLKLRTDITAIKPGRTDLLT